MKSDSCQANRGCNEFLGSTWEMSCKTAHLYGVCKCSSFKDFYELRSMSSYTGKYSGGPVLLTDSFRYILSHPIIFYLLFLVPTHNFLAKLQINCRKWWACSPHTTTIYSTILDSIFMMVEKKGKGHHIIIKLSLESGKCNQSSRTWTLLLQMQIVEVWLWWKAVHFLSFLINHGHWTISIFSCKEVSIYCLVKTSRSEKLLKSTWSSIFSPSPICNKARSTWYQKYHQLVLSITTKHF